MSVKVTTPGSIASLQTQFALLENGSGGYTIPAGLQQSAIKLWCGSPTPPANMTGPYDEWRRGGSTAAPGLGVSMQLGFTGTDLDGPWVWTMPAVPAGGLCTWPSGPTPIRSTPTR